uniref:Uncharacterized protein n=1 Tax=Ditylenchus dipsaci TaxID=166011 RepID=A0A915ENZ5_9BILA
MMVPVVSEWMMDKFAKSDCGITNALCGDEDNVIHCFKDHGPVPEGMQMLQDARFAAIVDMPATEEIDADQDQENGYVSDESFDIEL